MEASSEKPQTHKITETKLHCREMEISNENYFLEDFSSCRNEMNDSVLSLEEKMGRFRVLIERQVETLKGAVENGKINAVKTALNCEFEKLSGLFGLLNSTVFEKQWEHELQKQVWAVVFKSYFDEFQFKLHGQIDSLRSAQKDWENKVTDFNTLREELSSISESLLLEVGNVSKVDKDFCTGTGIGTEDELEVHLKHLSKDETINYFKCEIAKMRRQNEIILAEKTEELFKLKREILKEKRSVSACKDKDFEFVRAKLPEIIDKMDEIVSKEVKWPSISVNQSEEICRLEAKINSLLGENKNLKDLVEKTKNVVHKCYLSEQVYLANVNKYSTKIENMKILEDVRDMVHRAVYEEAFEGHMCKFEDMRIQMEKLQEKYSVQENHLVRVDKEMEKLKEIISFFMDENEKLALGLESRLERQRKKIESIRVGTEMLKEKTRNHKECILDSKREIEINKNKFDGVLKQGMWEKITEFENVFEDSIERNEYRLRKLSSELSKLVEPLNEFKKNEMRYKQMLQIRTSNLEKAEAEVDLLGDEVDALLSLLGHIYLALDHYSPVFVHYPGVTEILKLVKSELQGKHI